MSLVAVILLVVGLFALLGLVAWGAVLQSRFQTQFAAKFQGPRADVAVSQSTASRELVGQHA